MESFALHILCINDYERKIDSVVNKFYSAGLTVQPFLIVVGVSESDLRDFYIYIDGNLLKFKSFIESLDTCFKIFQVLSLKYPVACQHPWLLIQKYFFQIDTLFDTKSSNIISVLQYLQE